MFIEFRDGTGFVQVVVEKSTVGDENFEKADKLRLESSLIVRGKVKKDERAPSGVEILATEVIPVQIPTEDFQSKNQTTVLTTSWSIAISGSEQNVSSTS